MVKFKTHSDVTDKVQVYTIQQEVRFIMKKRIAILLSILLVTTTITVFAISADGQIGQNLIKKGYTEQDLAEIDAIVALSDENIVDYIVQKYKVLGDWKKVREAYGISETTYENHMKAQAEWQAILDKIPDEFMTAMRETMTRQEINYFINRMNIMDIDFNYAWKQYHAGKTPEEILAEKKAEKDKISELTTTYVMSDMSETEYWKAYSEIKGGDDITISQILMEVKQLRTDVRNRHKLQSGITDEEIKYCESQGMTNPMDMFRAKYISKGNKIPLENVVASKLKHSDWTAATADVLKIPEAEYRRMVEETQTE